MIIDTHCHIYPDNIAEKASKNMSGFYSVPLKYNGTIGHLLEVEKAAGVEKIFIHSVATAASQVQTINRFIAQIVAQYNGKIIGLGTLHPDSPNLQEDIALIKSLGLKGVKMHADIQKIAIDDKRCYKIYELCEGKMPVLLHAGDHRYNYSNPDNLIPVLKDFPKLTVIAAHFGGWSVWEDAFKKLPRFENLYVDTSSTYGFTNAEFIKKCIKSYDINRILFGSDYPMWEPANEIEMLKSLSLSSTDYDKIFFENAVKLYNISL